jgi:hypothetical protein
MSIELLFSLTVIEVFLISLALILQSNDLNYHHIASFLDTNKPLVIRKELEGASAPSHAGLGGGERGRE